MGWEWRIFFAKNDSVTFSIVGKEEREMMGGAECRTDVYQALGHASLGLKMRGGGSYELKIRTDNTDDGWEKWSKRHLPSRASSSMAALKSQLHGILKPEDESLHAHVQEYLCEKETLDTIHVSKSRLRFYEDGILVEQTDLRIHHNEKHIGDYRSIGVDGNRDSIFPRHLRERMGADLVDQSMVSGYPEFIERLLQEKATLPQGNC